MEGQGGDLAHVGTTRRMAGRTNWSAFLPAQDQEDGFPGAILGNCLWLAGRLVDGLKGKVSWHDEVAEMKYEGEKSRMTSIP